MNKSGSFVLFTRKRIGAQYQDTETEAADEYWLILIIYTHHISKCCSEEVSFEMAVNHINRNHVFVEVVMLTDG